MKISRHFTKTPGKPYEEIRFEERSSEIRHTDGSSASDSINVVVPDSWSQLASDILAQKYLRKSGVPEVGGESDARQVFHRLAGCWKSWGEKFGYFESTADGDAFYDECCYMLAHQMVAPNSPQWFNTGLNFAYGIEGPSQGHFYVLPDTNEVCESTSAYERPQPHACFIQSVQDDLVGENGIMDLWSREARLFKYGSGTGTNFSTLRSQGEPLSGGGRSSGLLSFLKIGDRAAGAIKSGGTTRRAAKMVCLDLDHPDVEDFIDWKVKEEQKVAALIAGSKSMELKLKEVLHACNIGTTSQNTGDAFDPESNGLLKAAILNAKKAHIPLSYIVRVVELAKQGYKDIEFEAYDSDWNSEAYHTVSGQNSNNSLRIPNTFMDAVKKDKPWYTRLRTNQQIAKTMDAKSLWDEISYAAWQCADPGLQFDTTINEWHTCPNDGPIRASNPCSEYMFLDDTACNLASLNLLKFFDPDKGQLDLKAIQHACRIWTTVLDISVQMAQYPSRSIARNSWDYRTLGLGYANLGALLMHLGIPYGSDEALAITGGITAVMTAEAYKTSAEMAKELGAFPRFENNRTEMLRVISNHCKAAHGSNDYDNLAVKPMALDHVLCPKELRDLACESWDKAYEMGLKYGYRNAQVTAIAPTGTIGLLMDCDTTGIEPDFALVKFKKLAGGGYFKIINQSIPAALKKLGYTKKQIKDMINYCIGHKTLAEAPIINFSSLKEKGFTEELLIKINNELPQAFDISFVINKYTIGESFCIEKLRINPADLASANANILKLIGFTEEDIDHVNEYVCGAMTLEGAPHIKPEHLPVFDCANRCGRKGSRSISAIDHVRMMAAAQPFISGAISKTVNLPYESTVEDIKKIFTDAWSMMIKAIAIYRDGSKLSQPLNSQALKWFDHEEEIETPAERIKKIAIDATNYISKNQRRLLPSRRSGYTQKVRIGGHSVYLRTGEYEDNSLGEIFLDINKEGTLLRSMMNSFAIAVSLGLQYGVPLEEFVDVFIFSRFEPNGFVQQHDRIKNATSIIDFVFRDLAINYLDRYDLAHIPLESNSEKAKVNLISHQSSTQMYSDGSRSQEVSSVRIQVETRDEARIKGYEGDPCPECGSLCLVRNGSCLKCDQCGSTTGCS
jgi:ribonucleoside-diphosphate reductase alpha chain